MDTLCIPVLAEHRTLKMNTIHNMASIYAMATSVLILDQDLMSLARTRYNRELLCRILCCVWMWRSWTLQEALLAQSWTVQFRDGALKLQSLDGGKSAAPFSEVWIDRWGSRPDSQGPNSRQYLIHTDDRDIDVKKRLLEVFVQNFICFKPMGVLHLLPTTPTAHQFASAWNALAARSTTKNDDLFLIFANVLDFETESLAGSQDFEADFQRMVLSFDELPLSLLFLEKQKPSRVTISRDPWIPSRLGREILHHGSTMRFDHGEGVLELVKLTDTCLDYTFNTSIVSSKRWSVKLEGLDGYYDVERTGDRPVDLLISSGSVCLVIELNEPRGERCSTRPDQVPISCHITHRGAFFLISSVREEIPNTFYTTGSPKRLYLQYICPVRVKTQDSHSFLWPPLSGTRVGHTSEFRLFYGNELISPQP
jgi:hypothetical protein